MPRLSDREQEQRRLTGWPKVIPCIGPDDCGVTIKSAGPGDRLCDKCRSKNGIRGTSHRVYDESGDFDRVEEHRVRKFGTRCKTHDQDRPCSVCSDRWRRRREALGLPEPALDYKTPEGRSELQRKIWADKGVRNKHSERMKEFFRVRRERGLMIQLRAAR